MFIADSYTPGNNATNEDRKWNLMMDLWIEEDLPAPYQELITYDNEVNNGGHAQYFFNTADCRDIKTEIETILPALPDLLHENLKQGLKAFLALDDVIYDPENEVFNQCDEVFYDNEELLIEILNQFAATLDL